MGINFCNVVIENLDVRMEVSSVWYLTHGFSK